MTVADEFAATIAHDGMMRTQSAVAPHLGVPSWAVKLGLL